MNKLFKLLFSLSIIIVVLSLVLMGCTSRSVGSETGEYEAETTNKVIDSVEVKKLQLVEGRSFEDMVMKHKYSKDGKCINVEDSEPIYINDYGIISDGSLLSFDDLSNWHYDTYGIAKRLGITVDELLKYSNEASENNCTLLEIYNYHNLEDYEIKKLWYYDDNTEDVIIALSKMMYGECNVVKSKQEQAAVAWCAINIAGSYDRLYKVVTNRDTFHGYNVNNPVTDDLRALAEDVLCRYWLECYDEINVGRVLPSEYHFFHGDGSRNWFRINYVSDGTYWDWSLDNPYEN